MKNSFSRFLRLGFVVAFGCVRIGYADYFNVTPEENTYLQGYVQSGSDLQDVSNTYFIKIPDDYYADVTLLSGQFLSYHCLSAFNAHLNGYGNLKFGSPAQLTADTTLRISIKAFADTQCIPYGQSVSGKIGLASVTVYLPTYKKYDQYFARQGYVLDVTYGKKLADMYLSGVSLSESAIAVDETATLSFNVGNGGWIAAGSDSVVRIYDGSKQIGGDLNVPALGKQTSVQRNVTLSGLSVGTHKIRVVVDATGKIDEVYEANNEVSMSLRVYRRTPVDVTYDLNGGGKAQVVSVVAGELLGALPNVSRAGYDFLGWWSDPSDGVQIGSNEKITESRTFYAHWTARKTSVTLNRQFGGKGTRSVVATFDQPMLNINIPERAGYVFDGYWTKPDGEGVQYYSSGGTSARLWDIDASQMLLYAKWTGCKSVLSLDRRGGYDGTSSVAVEYYAPLPSIEPPSMEGWIFQGYFSVTNGQGVQYYDGQGEPANVCRFKNDSVLYAHWLPVKMEYSLVLDQQGGQGVDLVTATYGQSMPAITPPERDKHVFLGYYSAPGGNGKKYYNSDGSAAALWDSVSVSRLYASWEKAYHVKFDGNTGDSVSHVQYFTTDRWKLEPPAYLFDGHVLVGWALWPKGAPVFPRNAVVSKDVLGYGDDPDADEVTLYAVWGDELHPSHPAFSLNGLSLYTSINCGWEMESGKLRSSRTCGQSWISASFEGGGNLSAICTNGLFDTALLNFSFFTDGHLYTNCWKEGMAKDISVSKGCHLATWAFEKNLANSGWDVDPDIIGTVDDEIALRSIIEKKENRVAELLDEVCTIAIVVSGSSYSADKIRAAVAEAFANCRANESIGTFTYHVANKVTAAASNKLLGAWEKYDKQGIDSTGLMKKYGDYCDEAYSLMRDMTGLDYYMSAFATLERLSWQRSSQVIFQGEELPSYEAVGNVHTAIQRTGLIYDDLGEAIVAAVVELCAPSSSFSEEKRAECRCLAVSSLDYCWLNNYTFLKSKLNSEISGSQLGLMTTDYYRALNGTLSTPVAVALRTALNRAMELLSDKEALWTYVTDCGVVAMKTVVENARLGILPVPKAREGLSFDGWYMVGKNEPVSPQTAIEDDTLLLARWNTNQYTIVFNSAGGSSIDARTKLYGESLGPVPIPIREGYVFEGWYFDVAGNSAIDPDAPITEGKTIHAQWTSLCNEASAADAAMSKSGSSFSWDAAGICEIALSKSGWHLVSFNVLPDDASPANVFAEVADKIDQVVQGSRVWKPTTGGRLAELQIGVGYWVRTSTDNVSWSVDGASDQNVEVLLSKGWNLVGYPLLESGNPAVVLKSAFDSKKVSQIVDGSKVYPGRLDALEPGKGYWLYAPAACTITFDQN